MRYTVINTLIFIFNFCMVIWAYQNASNETKEIIFYLLLVALHVQAIYYTLKQRKEQAKVDD